MNIDLLNQPWQIHVTLASGYSAYLLAFMGIAGKRDAIHIAFATLVFGLIASFVLAIQTYIGSIWAGCLAFLVTCSVGILWRKCGRSALHYVLRQSDISWSNDDPTVLATLRANSNYKVSQIAVKLDDGRCLRCDDTSEFTDAPFGPCLIGQNGDVGLYLTHIDEADGNTKEMEFVRHEDYGARFTYVPAHRIQSINIRYL